MHVTRTRSLRGANLWSRCTALESIVELSIQERSLRTLPGFEERLTRRFPAALPTHVAEPNLAHVLERMTLALQAQAGCPVTFSRTAIAVDPGIYQVVVQYTEESVAQKALEFARALCKAIQDDQPFDIEAAVQQLRDIDQAVRLGRGAQAIVQAAIARGVPVRRFDGHKLVQLGWGARQHRIVDTETDRTGAIAESIAQDKQLTKMLLAAAAIPVPGGRPVDDAEDAWIAAQELGKPVVVKPQHGDKGRGVSAALTERAPILAAHAEALLHGESVIVEPFVAGEDFRLLVIGGRMVAAARVDRSVTPWISADVTDDVHPEIAARAVDATRIVGLDVCGVDVRCQHIGAPLEAQGGVILEVNATPDFAMHLEPTHGSARPVGEAVLDSLFPEGDNGRIPIVAVAGTNGKTTTTRLIAHILRTAGPRVGMTCTDGIYVDAERIDDGDCSGPRSARAILLNPQVEAAVFETARGGILREGLAFDRCDVAVVTNIGAGDHLGLSYITTVEDLAVVKRVLVENVAPDGVAVLNADDPMTVAMADTCPGSLAWFGWSRANVTLAANRARGGRSVFIEDGAIVAFDGQSEHRVSLAAIPITQRGGARFQVENAMAAIAATQALGLAWDTICAGLGTFCTDIRTTPGRFNVLQHRGATVIADYGHNPDAIRALVAAIDHMPAQRRTVVISAAGDRRDIDISQQTEILGDAFDEVILYQDACQRGRKDGEVLGLLRKGLAHARRTSSVSEIRGEFRAIETALSKLDAGDLALVLIDQVDASLAFIEQLMSQATANAA